MIDSVEKTTIRKIYIRLLPLLFVAYFICYLDRINVGFAALTMNTDLGFTATVYALGATAFFWGYCLFEVPSNIILEKVGARMWIARIMITWGLFSAATAFVTGATSFAVVRFFLGVCEAGFFPGIILYFTYWFPARCRGQVVGWFMTAIPVAIFLGAPISTLLLVQLDGLFGLAGWRWLFLCEAVPAVILGFTVLFYLTDRPAKAHWLKPRERKWLIAELAAERSAIEQIRVYTVLQSLLNLRVLALAIIYLGIGTASLGLVLFLPLMIKQLGLSNLMTGFATAIPYVVGTIGMVICGYITDRMHERRWNLFFTCLAAAVGLLAAALLSGSFWAHRLLRDKNVVLAAAFHLLERDGRCRRHRRDKFTGQRRRPDRAQPGWLAQGQYRQLRGRIIRDGRLRADLGDHDSHCGSSAAQAGRAHGSGRGGSVTRPRPMRAIE